MEKGVGENAHLEMETEVFKAISELLMFPPSHIVREREQA